MATARSSLVSLREDIIAEDAGTSSAPSTRRRVCLLRRWATPQPDYVILVPSLYLTVKVTNTFPEMLKYKFTAPLTHRFVSARATLTARSTSFTISMVCWVTVTDGTCFDIIVIPSSVFAQCFTNGRCCLSRKLDQ
eukprot:TRINITY_DN27353_c0_g1_i1.p2 TRINITY_DN27353_c0_g1~~TRINITY_DN27353_c0_g1_i1.p2  ORF type:complete len:136 (+),score=7.04 TRINITY_DN27353_c0_g1_i1:272-679(+)